MNNIYMNNALNAIFQKCISIEDMKIPKIRFRQIYIKKAPPYKHIMPHMECQ